MIVLEAVGDSRVSFGFARTLTERFATSCLILNWLKFYNRNLNGKKKNRSKRIAHWALTSPRGNEDCLTQWNELHPSSEREFGLVCKFKILFWKICCIKWQKHFFFESGSLVHYWQSSWQQAHVASSSGARSWILEWSPIKQNCPLAKTQKSPKFLRSLFK